MKALLLVVRALAASAADAGAAPSTALIALGRRIAFSGNYQVLVTNATGGARHYVTSAVSGVSYGQPGW